MKTNEINFNDVNDLLYYKDGGLYWKKFMGGYAKKDSKAGSLHKSGYVHIQLNKKIYKEHRLVYVLFNKHCPDFLDHIDGNRSNNRIENIRPATKGQNNKNSKTPITNTSSIKGVGYWHGRWRARIDCDKKHIFVGYFNTKEEAKLGIMKAREALHKDFCKHE